MNEPIAEVRRLVELAKEQHALAESPDVPPDKRAEHRAARDRYIADAEELRKTIEAAQRVDNIVEWLEAPKQAPPPPGRGPASSVTTAEYRRAFEAYIRTAGGSRPVRGFEYTEAERRVLETAADVLGGYTVPTDVQDEVLRRLPAVSDVLTRCRVINTSRDQVEWPLVLGRATEGSIWTSAFVGDWVSETPAPGAAEAEPRFGVAAALIKKARAICYISRDLAADSAFDIMGFLAEDGGDNLGLVVERGIIAGTGVAGQPLGILNTPGVAVTVLDTGPTANTIDSSTADQDAIHALIDMCYALPSQYTRDAVMLMQRATEGQLRKLICADGSYLWPPSAPTGQTFLGLTPTLTPFMEPLGTDGNRVILVGNLGAVIVAIRERLSAQVLMERRADEEQIGIILRTRVGVVVPNPDAFRIGRV